jgi:ureidoacrylate peracid hydrolase
MHDYHAIVVDDACATLYPDLHETTMKNFRLWFGEVANTDDLLRIWEENPPV